MVLKTGGHVEGEVIQAPFGQEGAGAYIKGRKSMSLTSGQNKTSLHQFLMPEDSGAEESLL